jgi:hypothetical protein
MKTILGDNPFFDINHKTGGTDLGFQKDTMKAVIEEYTNHGPCRLMLSDHLEFHDGIFEVLCQFRPEDLSLVLLAPVPHTINSLVATGGYKSLISNVGPLSLMLISFGLACQLGKITRLSTFFYRHGIQKYIRNQLKPYRNRNVNVTHFGLHNVFADMLLASKNRAVINSFIRAVEDLGLAPIILTQNMGSFLGLDGIRNCTICGSVNPVGYMMSPSKQETEVAICENKFGHKIWAMQVLAGGSAQVCDALSYLKGLKIKQFVYATSKTDRVKEVLDSISNQA